MSLSPLSNVVVDLSNVVRDQNLGPSDGQRASWMRWSRLERSWRVEFDGGGTSFTLVADSNLGQWFDRAGRIRLDEAIRSGLVLSSTEADGYLLKYAAEHDTAVLSNDLFTDYLRDPSVLDLSLDPPL